MAALPIAAGLAILSAGAAHGDPSASITITPSTVPASGGTLTISGTGFPAEAALTFMECASASDANDCDVTNVVMGAADESGNVSGITLAVTTGPIGADGHSCDSGAPCYIFGGTVDQSAQAYSPFQFAVADVSASTPTSSSSAPPSGGVSQSGGAGPVSKASPTPSEVLPTRDPTLVDPPPAAPSILSIGAGTGGAADREDVPAGVIVLAAVGAVAVAGGAVGFSRRSPRSQSR